MVKVSEDQPSKDSQGHLKPAEQGSGLPSLVFVRDSKAGRRVGKFYMEGGRLPVRPDGGRGPGGLAQSAAVYLIG